MSPKGLKLSVVEGGMTADAKKALGVSASVRDEALAKVGGLGLDERGFAIEPQAEWVFVRVKPYWEARVLKAAGSTDWRLVLEALLGVGKVPAEAEVLRFWNADLGEAFYGYRVPKLSLAEVLEP